MRRMELWKLGKCPILRWGVDRHNIGWYSGIYLFIDYGSLENTVRERAHQLISLFATTCGNSIRDLSHPTIPYPSNIGSSENLEIAIFHVPADDADKQAFKFAYRRYRVTTVHQYHYAGLYHFQPPMRSDHGAWLPEVSTADRSTVPTARYVGLFSSTSPEARDAWYGDFSQRAMTDYECPDHIIDWNGLWLSALRRILWCLKRRINR